MLFPSFFTFHSWAFVHSLFSLVRSLVPLILLGEESETNEDNKRNGSENHERERKWDKEPRNRNEIRGRGWGQQNLIETQKPQ